MSTSNDQMRQALVEVHRQLQDSHAALKNIANVSNPKGSPGGGPPHDDPLRAVRQQLQQSRQALTKLAAELGAGPSGGSGDPKGAPPGGPPHDDPSAPR